MFVAGEKLDGTTVEEYNHFNLGSSWTNPAPIIHPVPDFFLHKELQLCLKHLCREAVRKVLINVSPHEHLFNSVPRLPLPSALVPYLPYELSLSVEDNELNTEENYVENEYSSSDDDDYNDNDDKIGLDYQSDFSVN